MFQKDSSIQAVRPSFAVASDTTLFGEVNGSLQLRSLTNGTVLQGFEDSMFQMEAYCQTRDGYIGVGEDGVTRYSKGGKVVKEEEVAVAGAVILDERYVIQDLDFNFQTMEGIYGLYNIETKQTVWQTDFGGMLISENGDFFRVSRSSVERLNSDSGERIWRREMANRSDGNFLRINGASQDVVLVGNDSTDSLMALALDSGDLQWEAKTIPRFEVLSPIDNMLHSLTSMYVRRNPLDGRDVDEYLDEPYFNDAGIVSQRSNHVFTGDHLITTDSTSGRIGAFNTKTHRFDWVHEVPGVTFPVGYPLKYEDPYLLALDNQQTLHVFKRED